MDRSTLLRVAWIAMSIQVPLLAIIFFGEFTFDHPGPMGNWGFWEAWIFVYAVVLVIGLVASRMAKKYHYENIQCLAPILLTMGWWIYTSNPGPKYNPAEYQHLLGKTAEEIDQIISPRRMQTSGDGAEKSKNGDLVEYQFQTYNGMTLIFSMDGRVVKVTD